MDGSVDLLTFLGAVLAAVTLLAGIENLVATDGHFAACTTGIRLRVGILGTPVALLAFLDDPIAALGFLALIGALVVVALVRIIAFLAFVHDTIATRRKMASRTTGIRNDVGVPIRIVALLALVHDPITAAGNHAVGTTGIGLDIGILCSVIALLTLLLNAITAPGQLAVVGAEVDVVRIAIVTLFGFLEDAVSASGLAAIIGTVIVVGLVAVVALFGDFE